jgi:hypothetical protein
MDLEHRVIKLEFMASEHTGKLLNLHEIYTTLSKSLSGIEKTLAQIKWLAVGAAAVVFFQTVGIEKTIKFLL